MVLHLVACLAVEVTEVSLAFLAAVCMVPVAYLGFGAMVARAATEVQDLAAEVRVVSAAGEAAQNLAVEALADTEA